MGDNLTLTLSVPPTFLTKIAQEYGQIKQTEHKLLVQDLSGWLDKFINSTFFCSAKPSEGASESEGTGSTGAEGNASTPPPPSENNASTPPPPGSAFKKLCEHLFEQPGLLHSTNISKVIDPNLYKEYGADLDRMADIFSTFCGVTSSDNAGTSTPEKSSGDNQ